MYQNHSGKQKNDIYMIIFQMQHTWIYAYVLISLYIYGKKTSPYGIDVPVLIRTPSNPLILHSHCLVLADRSVYNHLPEGSDSLGTFLLKAHFFVGNFTQICSGGSVWHQSTYTDLSDAIGRNVLGIYDIYIPVPTTIIANLLTCEKLE